MAEERFCKNCGAPLAEEDEYCENCGASVNQDEMSDEEFNEEITKDTAIQKELNEEAEGQSRFTPEYVEFLEKLDQQETDGTTRSSETPETLVEEKPQTFENDLKLKEAEPVVEEKKSSIPIWVWILVALLVVAVIIFFVYRSRAA